MPAVRQPVTKRRSFWIWIAAAVIAAAAIFDWAQPPARQLSPALYEGAVIRPYRRLLSPALPNVVRCRYRPSCSQYSSEAVHFHGLPKGLWLTGRRILRCNPWAAAGTYDPVPAPPRPTS